MKHSQVWFRRSLFYNTILGEFSHENPANWLMRCWWVVGCEQDSFLSQFGGGKLYPTSLAMEWFMFFLGLTKRCEYWRGCRSPDFPKNFQPLGVLLPSHWYVPSLPKSDTSWVRDQLQGGSPWLLLARVPLVFQWPESGMSMNFLMALAEGLPVWVGCPFGAERSCVVVPVWVPDWIGDFGAACRVIPGHFPHYLCALLGDTTGTYWVYPYS